MSASEFFRLTLRLFAALSRRKAEERRRERLLVGLVQREIINFSFGRPKELVKLEDLVPEEDAEAPATRKHRGGRRRLTAKLRGEIADSWRRTLMAEMEAAKRS